MIFFGDFGASDILADFNFVTSSSLDARFTFSRAAGAQTRVTSSGLIATVADGVARFNHDLISGTARGLLIEGARTNLRQRSEEFDNAYWSKVGTVTAGVGTDPAGGSAADQLASGTSNYVTRQSTGHGGGSHYFSAYLRGTSASGSTYISTSRGIAVPTHQAAVSYTTTWARYGVHRNNSDTEIYSQIGQWQAGQGPSTDLLMYGAQLETGSFPSSYIPTTSANATRNADFAYIDGANFTSLWSGTTQSVVIEADLAALISQYIWMVSDAGGTFDWLAVGGNTAGNVGIEVITSGVSQASATIGAYTAGTTFKVALSRNGTAIRACVNGGAVSSITATIPPVTRMNFGHEPGGSLPMFGHHRRCRVYNRVLSDAELQSLSS